MFNDYKTNEELTIARHPLQLLTMKVDFKVERFDMLRLASIDK